MPPTIGQSALLLGCAIGVIGLLGLRETGGLAVLSIPLLLIGAMLALAGLAGLAESEMWP